MSYNNIDIHKMSNEDFEEIKDTLTTEFDNFWNAATLKEELQNSNSYYIVVKDVTTNNKIVGFAGLKIVIDEADLMYIVTRKDKRNLGIATAMLDNLINNVAKQKNIKKITLEVNQKNTSAIKLYQKFNFKQIAIRKKYYKNVDDAIIMQKILKREP